MTLAEDDAEIFAMVARYHQLWRACEHFDGDLDTGLPGDPFQDLCATFDALMETAPATLAGCIAKIEGWRHNVGGSMIKEDDIERFILTDLRGLAREIG